jgi:hypothetical protein
MATYQTNTLGGGFHPITNAVLGLSRAFADPSYTLAGQKARQEADYNVARIGETNANTRKLDAARLLDEQKYSGRAGLESAISGAFNPDGSINQQRLAATLGTLAQGDQLGNADKVLSLSQLFAVNPGDEGYDAAARRSLIAGGHMPDEDFAATSGRADQISARDAGEALTQAVRVQGMQDQTSITNNILDNKTSVANNTADNVQLGINNQLDNTTRITIADADRIQKTADGTKPLYTAFQDADGNVFTFDTHAASPAFTPALTADGTPLSNITKIGTPGRGGAAPKVYSLSPTQLMISLMRSQASAPRSAMAKLTMLSCRPSRIAPPKSMAARATRRTPSPRRSMSLSRRARAARRSSAWPAIRPLS